MAAENIRKYEIHAKISGGERAMLGDERGLQLGGITACMGHGTRIISRE